MWILGGTAAIFVLAFLGVRALLYDACTQSFERSPHSIVVTFLNAVGDANAPVAQECWEHEAYYDPEAGCSELCLSRVYAAQFDVTDISVGQPYLTPDTRTNLVVKVAIRCSETGESHRAEIVLDTVGPNLPWKHWQIVESSFGGTVAMAWCK
jgi:hypothetical protein